MITGIGSSTASTSATANGRGKLPVARVDLAALDAVVGDTLVLFCWSDVRPLRGAGGFVDWRLCGAVSRTFEQRSFAAERDEVMLMPAVGRLGKRRIFVFGLGPSTNSSHAELLRACDRARDVLERARVERAVFVAPRTAATDDATEADFVGALGLAFADRLGIIETVLVEDVPAGY